MSRWIPIFAFLTFAGTAFAQRDFSAVEIKATKLTDRVYMLEGSGGNIGVSVGADGVLIVDDQFAPLADKIRAAIGELGGGDPTFILNTHYHGDHTGGNAHFGEKGVIVAHRNVRNRLAARRVDDRPLPEAALPEITFDIGLSIHFNGEELRVVHFPKAHTDGDGVVFFTGSNVVHTGDLFFNGRFPYVDLRAGGDVQGYIDAVRSLLKQIPQDARIIPGHGPLARPDDLRTALEMLETCADLVKEAIDAGRTLEEIQAAGVPEKWRSWGQGWMSTDRWLAIVYNSHK
jgi:glyoxylase-like metal-dependent hydrolase (beta-lactamase superfamily II)